MYNKVKNIMSSYHNVNLLGSTTTQSPIVISNHSIMLGADHLIRKTQNNFFTVISFDFPHKMLSSRGITTFTWTFHHVFRQGNLLCGIRRT